jgi:hypothetical protein
MYDSILGQLQGFEENLVRWATGNPQDAVGLKMGITTSDVIFLVEELYQGRSVLTGISTRLVLVRWRSPESSPITRIGAGVDEQKSTNVRLRDLVCLTKEEAKVHFNRVLVGGERVEDVYGQDMVGRVRARLREAEECERFRL